MTDVSEANPNPDTALSHRRMEYISFIAQIVSSAGIIVSLIFVGVELTENTKVAVREESNASMSQWSSFRTSIYEDRNTAEVFRIGIDDSRPLDPTDQLRFDYVMREHAWATYQLWDRSQEGLVPTKHFALGAGPDFLRIICTPGGRKVWSRIRSELPKSYVAELEGLMASFEATNGTSCKPSSSAVTPPVE